MNIVNFNAEQDSALRAFLVEKITRLRMTICVC